MTPFQRKMETRNRMIVAAIKEGVSPATLADAYGLCRSRITQIGQAAGVRKRPSPSLETCEKLSAARQAQVDRMREEQPPTHELVGRLRQTIYELRHQIKTLRSRDQMQETT